MACGFEKELLSALIDGELPEREKSRVQSHIDACSECRKEYADVQSASSMLHQVGPAKAPASILKAVEREINREPQVQEGFFARYRRALQGAMALAGAVLVVLTIVAITGRAPSSETVAKRPQSKPAPITQMPSREKAFDGERALKDAKNEPETAKLKELQNKPAAEPPAILDETKKRNFADDLAKGDKAPAPPPAPMPAKPQADSAPHEVPAEEAKPQPQVERDLAKEEKRPPEDPSGGESTPPAPAPADKSDEVEKKVAEKAAVRNSDVTIILYVDRLSDARDLVSKELAKLTKNSTYKESVFTATMNSTQSARLTQALKTHRTMDLVEVPAPKAEAFPELAERSRSSWDESLGMAKAKDSRSAESKKAPTAESQEAPKMPQPAFNAQRSEAPKGMPAPGAAPPPSAPAQKEGLARGGKAQSPEPAPTPAPPPRIDTGVASSNDLTVRIYLVSKTAADTLSDELRRIEAPVRSAEKK
jgi:hypothetical protein